MLLHKSRYVSLNPGPAGADTLDQTIDGILQQDLVDPRNGKFPRLVGVEVTPAGADRFFVTVLAEGEPR